MIRLLCGDERRSLTLRETRDGLEVTVDGETHHLSVERVGPGTFVARDGHRVETFHCVSHDGRVHLAWRGSVYVLEQEREGARAAQRHQASGLEAPMPGKVIKVAVEVGQEVKKGDEVLVVEAMKMENALRAPKDGVVRSVAVRVGDMVNPGVVLVDIE